VIVDTNLLDRHRANPADLFVENGCFTNWLGIRTDADLFSNGDDFRNRVMPDLPVTEAGDGVFAGYLEYASLLTAIESTPDRDTFTAVEIGAGWGPWISACGVVCRNLGFARTVLRGVEADQARHDMMRRHLARNGLMGAPSIDCQTVRGAAWTENTTLRFPVIDLRDSGAAASDVILENAHGQDYRGHESAFVDVPAFSLATICEGLGIIDYMHCDIQGAELALMTQAIDFLNARVRHLFVGTHSRVIDGGLIGLFHRHGWDILAEMPCQFNYNRNIPTLEGMTLRDGEIFVRNPNLVG
jgi:hypothetical protein